MTRFLKQFIYGVFYLAVLVFIAILVYSAVFKAPAAVSDEASQSPPVPEIPEPTLVFENLRTEVDGNEVKVTGVLKNESPQLVKSVRIRAALFDKNGSQIFSSETLKEGIGAFEATPFTVFFPKDIGLAERVNQELTAVSYVFE